MTDDKTSKDSTGPSATPRDGLPKISVPSIPKIKKLGGPAALNSIPSLKAPSEQAPEPIDVSMLEPIPDADEARTLPSDVDLVPLSAPQEELPLADDSPTALTPLEEPSLPMIEVAPLEEATEMDDSAHMGWEPASPQASLMEATNAPQIEGEMGAEATMLMTESEGVFLGEPDLDDFEEDGATMVFDSMSGIDLASVQAGGLDTSGIQTSAPAPAPQLNWESGAPLRGTDVGEADDFTAQATEILQSPFEQDLVTPKLRFIDGPVQGQESFISGLVATFGRGDQNTMMVADLAMSRNHFEISRQPDESFMVRDLGSANGTSLNGTPIKEAALYHGDRIEAGKSVMAFEAPQVSPKARRYLIPAQAQATMAGIDQPTPMNELTSMAAIQIDQTTRFFTRVSIGAAVVCVPLIGALLFLSLRPTETTAAPAAVAVAEQSSGKKQAADLYLKGVEQVKAREWDTAQASFKQAKALDPALNIRPQLNLLVRERKAQAALAKAQSLVAQNKQQEVNTVVDTIPPESVYASEAYKLRRQQLRDDLESLYKSAQAKFSEEALDASQALAQQVIERSPEHEGAKTLLASIATRKAEIARASATSAQDPTSEAPNPFGAGTRPVAAPIVDAGAEDIKRGIALYRRGKFDEAVQAFKASNSSKAKRYVKHVSSFRSTYPAGKSSFSKKQWSKAISQLERARRADRLVSNSYKKEIAQMLSTAHANQGLASVKAGKYRNARKSYITGKRYGNSAAIRELNQTLESKAKSLYIKATSLKRSNPEQAGLLCRKIMLMVPTSSPTWKKAQRVMMDF